MVFISRIMTASLLLLLTSAGMVYGAEDGFNSAATDIYQDPGFNTNRDYSSSRQEDSIDPFSGQLKILVVDLHVPGNGGLDIDVVRNYQSNNNDRGPYNNGHTARTPFGTGWDINFGRILVPNNNSYRHINASNSPSSCKKNNVATGFNPYLELPDGSRELLANSLGTDYAFITKNRWIGKCLPTGENANSVGGLIVFSPEGKKYTFNLLGSVSPDKPYMAYFVTKIEDLDGNSLQFDYFKPSGNTVTRYTLLKSIVASDGRRVDFDYADVTNDAIGWRPRLTSIKGGGKSVAYNYNDADWFSGTNELPHYLTSVRYADGTKWSYKYIHRSDQANFVPGRFSISEMTSPLGLNTSYTYEYRQMGALPAEKVNVVTSRTLSSVAGADQSKQVWKYSYTKGYSPNNDKTLVAGPQSCVRYEHIGSDTISKATITNELWKLGLLVKKETLDGSACSTLVRSEQSTWDSQKISYQNEVRRYGAYNFSQTQNGTYTAILAKMVVQQGGSNYTTEYTYDENGQPTRVVESGQKTRTKNLTYSRPGGNWVLGLVATQSISGISGNISFSYNTSARVTQKNEYGVITKYSYTSRGDVSAQTDANGRTTRYEDYYRGVPRLITYPDGTTVKYTVNSSGTVASRTDELGRVTSYSYDDMDRIVSIVPPKGLTSKIAIKYAFGSNGATETLSVGAYRRVRNYNQLGQLFNQAESGTGSAIIVAARYDSQGNRTFFSNPNYLSASSSGERRSFDALNRITKITNADGTSSSFSYQTGNKVSVSDERSNVTTKEFVAFGEPNEKILSKVTQPGGVTTSLSLDNLGRVTSVMQDGLTRTFVFSSNGFLASENHPESGVTQYTRDAVGNVLSKKVGAAAADLYTYDMRNRLTTVTYGGSTLRLANTFDKGGRLATQSFGSSTWTYSYDAHDNLLSESVSLASPSRTFKLSYSYNATDALSSMTYPSGLIIDFSPDAYGRPTKAGAYAKSISYHANGAIQQLHFGNDRKLTVTLDNRLRPVERVVYGTDLPMQQRLVYDATSNVIQVTDLQNSGYSQKLTYDTLNRISSGVGGWGTEIYSYNNRGDITSRKLGTYVINYAYDTRGRLSGLSGNIQSAVTYDEKGNVLAARSQYRYDLAGNLSLVCLNARSDCAARPDLQYSYDARQRKIVSTDSEGNRSVHIYSSRGLLASEESLTSGTVKDYIYVGRELVAHSETCSAIDSDGDGLPDCYEKRLGLDPDDRADGYADSDGDGVLNYQEYRYATKIRNVDSDNDGMPDGWELRFGLDPNSASDAHLDLNGDGVSNLEHFTKGTPASSLWPAVLPALNVILN
ncbi:RHS repeat protein [Pseudomonas stutzeri]|uniref:RHS repeat protein n=2 Tax=Stutzerimonas stutzeri TaxID=316 RepID=UPI00210931B8|nr:RHS repeat protein [Stutzerimonas stutzeri]MCQ4298072.1 RHS repeat protein [Stutzerimonas stutzeri]